MLRNGQQQINLNQANVVGGFPCYYQTMIPGQAIITNIDGTAYPAQPVYNMQANIQPNNLSITPQVSQPQPNKRQSKHFNNFNTIGARNADDMIKSIVIDPKSLITDMPKKQLDKRPMVEDGSNNNNYFSFHNHNSIIQIPTPTNMPIVSTQIDDEDDFGDFVGVEMKTSGVSPSIGNASHTHLTPVQPPFTDWTGSSEVSESIDNFSLYGIQMPKWITNDRLLPDIYKKVLQSVTRNGTIDTRLLHSELLRSGLPREVLGHLWEMCNKKVRGTMDRSEVCLMLAMISICQNKLDCSSLHTLTKCPQAPIPKLDFNDNVVPDFKQLSAHRNSASLSSSSYANNMHAPPDNDTMINDTYEEKLSRNVVPSILNNKSTTHAVNHLLPEPTNCYTSRSVDKVSSETNNNHPLQQPSNSCQKDAKFVSNFDDDEFDDFQMAPNVPNKFPPKPVVRLSSSSSHSSTVSLSPPPPQAMSRKTPTLLSLASPVLANLQSRPFPSMAASFEPQLPSATTSVPSAPRTGSSSSPPDLMSDAICEDKYAAFRQLQFTDDVPDDKKNSENDDDFGEFESGLPVGATIANLTFPSTDVCDGDLLGFNSIIPSTVPSSKSCNVVPRYEVITDKKQHRDHPQENKSKNDWSDFLGLDNCSQRATFTNDDDDDDFEEFVSHKSRPTTKTSNDDITSKCEINNGSVQLNSAIFAPVELLQDPAKPEMKLNLDIFNDVLPSDNKNYFYHNKDGGLLAPCNTWNSLIDQLEDEPQNVKKLSTDNISFRSLDFKVSKPLSSNQTPDDSQSTSSDLEKKSADNRSISSLDLFPSNDSNIASSGNSQANNTADPSPNFMINSGKPLDAKEILNKMGGVIAADRYYGLVDHSQDRDSHAYQWLRCMKVVNMALRQANEVFSDTKEERLMRELLKAEKGIIYLKGLAEMFLVAARISYQMKVSSIFSEDLKKLQKSIDDEWQNLSSTIPEDISSLFLPPVTLTSVDSNPLFRQLLEPKDLDAYKSSCGLCLLCVNACPMYASNTSQDKLEYGGRSYHPQCANLWINCVDLTLPSLNIPELL